MLPPSHQNQAGQRPQSQKSWLLLTDYASKYRVSVSTLRRRIKTGVQEHRFENGKYYLAEPNFKSPDLPSRSTMAPATPERDSRTRALDKHPEAHADFDAASKQVQPPAGAAASQHEMPAQVSKPTQGAYNSPNSNPGPNSGPNSIEESLLRTTTRLVDELKRAYTQVLQEKEEQILILKDEIADLKTLVRVLEFDRERRLERAPFEPQK